jgi:hypothetical protein
VRETVKHRALDVTCYTIKWDRISARAMSPVPLTTSPSCSITMRSAARSTSVKFRSTRRRDLPEPPLLEDEVRPCGQHSQIARPRSVRRSRSRPRLPRVPAQRTGVLRRTSGWSLINGAGVVGLPQTTKRNQLSDRRWNGLLPTNRAQPPQCASQHWTGYPGGQEKIQENAQSTVESELVLRLAGLLWRLCRATAIESGLFKIQAKQLPQFRQQRQPHQKRQKIIDSIYRNAVPAKGDDRPEENTLIGDLETGSPSLAGAADQLANLTRSFDRLCNLPTYPLDRLHRYEAALWRQADQLLFTLSAWNADTASERIRKGRPTSCRPNY